MRNNRHPAIWSTVLAWLLVVSSLCLSMTVLASVNAHIDRPKVYEGDRFTLIIDQEGPGRGDPDLSPLNKDFRILGTGTSNHMSIINGRRSDRTSWDITLEPRRLGKLQIPPIQVGTEKTRPIEVEVSPVPELPPTSTPNGPVFMEAEIENKGNVYVQQQVPYVVRLYFDDSVVDGDLRVPPPENTVIEQLGKDSHYMVTRNGRPYHVIERHLVISPEKSGRLHIPPAIFKGRIALPKPKQQRQQRRSRHSDLMDRFFGSDDPFANDPFFSDSPLNDDPFFSGGLFGSKPSRPVRINSKSFDIDVLPVPAQAGKNWLPAEAVELEDSWIDNPPQLKVGEPATRTITIRATGLSGAQLPVLPIDEPANARVYAEKPEFESRSDGSKVYGISRQTLTYIPSKAGKLTVPAVDLKWWNVRTNASASSDLPEWTLYVLPGSGKASSEPPASAVTRQPQAQQGVPGKAAEMPPSTGNPVTGIYKWLIAAVIGVLLVALLIAVWLRRRPQKPAQINSPSSQPAQKPAMMSDRAIMQQLRDACESNDPKAAEKALLALANYHWPDDPPRNLGALAQTWPQASDQLHELDRYLYGGRTGEWDGAALWEAVRNGPTTARHEHKEDDTGLQPLYPSGRDVA